MCAAELAIWGVGPDVDIIIRSIHVSAQLVPSLSLP